MGRTVPSFTLALMEEESEWRAFRKRLSMQDRKVFDDLFAVPKLYIASCMFSANPVVTEPIFLSMIFHHQKQLAQLAERVEKISRRRSRDGPVFK